MAIYHFAATIIKRSQGRSATAAAAYRSATRIPDHRTGAIHDYSRRKGVFAREIHAPASAPRWAFDRETLWNTVEFGERRKDAQVAREVNLALPRELSHAQQRDLLQRFVEETFVASGMVADCAYHDLDSPNPHAHILLTMRDLTPVGFGNKNRLWDDVECLRAWRALWAVRANQALENAGRAARIDHRSLAEQGKALLPTVHVGPKWTNLNRERPSTPLAQRDQRSQANAAIAALNGARESRWATDPHKAARSAAAHYDRLAMLWHRTHNRAQLEARVQREVPQTDALLERMSAYVRRRTALQAAEHAAAVENHAATAPPGPEVAAQRTEMRLWVDRMRGDLGRVVGRINDRRRAAVETLAVVEQLESEAGRWRRLVEDSMPAYRRRAHRDLA